MTLDESMLFKKTFNIWYQTTGYYCNIFIEQGISMEIEKIN